MIKRYKSLYESDLFYVLKNLEINENKLDNFINNIFRELDKKYNYLPDRLKSGKDIPLYYNRQEWNHALIHKTDKGLKLRFVFKIPNKISGISITTVKNPNLSVISAPKIENELNSLIKKYGNKNMKYEIWYQKESDSSYFYVDFELTKNFI
jgi:hypothetical protein